MQIKRIEITKSKTVGMVSQHGRSQFKKAQLMAEGTIEEGEDENEAYKKLSDYLEKGFEYEKTLK